jgi:hypothetical protein
MQSRNNPEGVVLEFRNQAAITNATPSGLYIKQAS